MKQAFLTALITGFLATPLLAHSGPHVHPHSAELGMVAFATLLVITAAACALKARK
ncbi:peptidase M23 [Sulfitobacter mediterraneus]|uniref:peptidase M23 n=1 Tax=Sulfitobacter mediterraneus TaxID=83219 RepID=UPI000B1DFCFB|nr:peptidase M23 [Sulfitobacter mediterraneus]